MIVGLKNPGPRYAATRHNVGADFVERLAHRFNVELKNETRFKGLLGRGNLCGHDVRLLVPTTFMNLSGESVAAVARFFRIASAEILVVHDEMAFAPGVIRIKQGGGANGHNGLRNIIQHLGNDAGFVRLRIGVGHPGNPKDVTRYLTGVDLPAAERKLIESAYDISDEVLQSLLSGDLQKAMNLLHAPNPAGTASPPPPQT